MSRNITPEILIEFDGQPVSKLIYGPKTFIRIGGLRNNPMEKWWFEITDFFKISNFNSRFHLSDTEWKHVVLKEIRSVLSLSLNINSLADFWIMEIPSGNCYSALVGKAKAQPAFLKNIESFNNDFMLSGGLTQYYFPTVSLYLITRFGEYFDL